ncbi:MAG: DUF1127 domain-containing protein [Proteobacteria bacterium]|nr:DUF1127 domain-containing protein [Pseudomonadota bacterium]
MAATFRIRLRELRRLAKLWRDRKRKRDQLATFDERQLKDIGLSRIDALQEARKPFWRA